MGKIGLYFPFETNLDLMSVNINVYAKVVEVLGDTPLLIIPKRAETSCPFERLDCDSNNVGQICGQNLDMIIALTWYLEDSFISEYRACGGKVLTLGDDDGLVDPLAFAFKTLKKFLDKQIGLKNKLKACKHWAMVFSNRLSGKVPWINGIKNSDCFTLPNPNCCHNLKTSVKGISENLQQKIKTLYFPVDDAFYHYPINQKKDRIITVSRFGDDDETQKNSNLMEKVVYDFMGRQLGYEWIFIGRNATGRFSKLRGCFPGIKCFDRLDKVEIAKMMAGAKIMLFTSRWEGSPVSANEMLSSGGTIVGPPIPGIIGLTKNNTFGITSKSHSKKSILLSIDKEIKNWNYNRRDPFEIRNYWKKRVSITAVASRIQEIRKEFLNS